IHTWPEHGFAAVDAFLCGAARADEAVDAISGALAARIAQRRRIERGLAGAAPAAALPANSN
ncbi:S-adenosylmethionine decarboxylase, partial [Burkholderia sp. Cy-637]|uniref:S-adenosylmethionine decarboxylase n=1 Tax=Burkholderia sp. Cy-637 TaxID=2608327 RepID=UPI00196473EA